MTDQPIDRTATMEGVPLQVTIQVPLDRLFPSLVSFDPEDGPEPTNNQQELIEAVAQIIARELDHDWRYRMREDLRAMVKQIVEEKVTAMVTEVLDQDVTPTDGMGNVLGLTKPFRSMIMESATKWAEGKADYRSPTNLEKVIAAEVGAQFTQAAKAAIAGSKTQINTILSQRAAKIIAATLDDVSMTDIIAAANPPSSPTL